MVSLHSAWATFKPHHGPAFFAPLLREPLMARLRDCRMITRFGPVFSVKVHSEPSQLLANRAVTRFCAVLDFMATQQMAAQGTYLWYL
jgi:hypothetical protein